jgi:hypothetical protein
MVGGARLGPFRMRGSNPRRSTMITKSSIMVGHKFDGETVIASAYHEFEPERFVVLTLLPHQPREPYWVYIVSRVKDEIYAWAASPQDWDCHYSQGFRTIEDAINGHSENINTWDKMADQARPWVFGYIDCLRREV